MKRLAMKPRSATRCLPVLSSLSGLLIVAISGVLSFAVEIEIKSQVTCSGVIRLGDVADVFGGSDEEIAKLKSVELGPAPRAGASQWISIREIQDALWKRNIDYVSHRFSGANRVEVRNALSEPRRFETTASVSTLSADRPDATKVLAEQVTEFLKQRVDNNTDWRVRVNLTPSDATTIQSYSSWEIARVPRRPLSGDVQAWLGSQQIAFEPLSDVRQASTAPLDRINIVVDISLPPTVVALRYDVRSGTVLAASHLQVQTIAAENEHLVAESMRPEDVIGKEVIRTLFAGQLLDSSMIRSPQLVKKSDAVTVIVTNGAVRLRAVGIAMANGSMGEMIDVQSEFQKEHFVARVVGPATVAVDLNPQREAQQANNLQRTHTTESTIGQRSSGSSEFRPRLQHVNQTNFETGASQAAGGANLPTTLPGRATQNDQQTQNANEPSRLKWNRG